VEKERDFDKETEPNQGGGRIELNKGRKGGSERASHRRGSRRGPQETKSKEEIKKKKRARRRARHIWRQKASVEEGAGDERKDARNPRAQPKEEAVSKGTARDSIGPKKKGEGHQSRFQ